MGRIHKALVKADRWKEAHIGLLTAEPLIQEAPLTTSPSVNVVRPEQKIISPHQEGTSPKPSLHTVDLTRLAFRNAFTSETRVSLGDDRISTSEDLVSSAEEPLISSQNALDHFVEPKAQHRSERTRQALDTPVLCVDVSQLRVSRLLSSLGGSNDLASQRYGQMAEQLLENDGRSLRSILVTSPSQGDGKTTIAINLAAEMAAKNGRRVLLIDANLERPAIDKYIRIRPERSWLELMSGSCRFSDAAVRINPIGLYLFLQRSTLSLVARSNTAHRRRLFSASSFHRLLREMGELFDTILVDASAIRRSEQARNLASMTDGTILVVRSGSTRRDSVDEALRRIPGDRRLGVVLNEAL